MVESFIYDPSIIIFTVLAETTEGVYQASGYGDITDSKSIWFVFHSGASLCNFYLCPNQQVLVFCRTQ